MTRLYALGLFLTLLVATAQPGRAQLRPLEFGSADNPTETRPPSVLLGEARVSTFAGPSYIGVRWRSAVGFEADFASGPVALALGGRIHAGTEGLYEPDVDEAYDLLRLVQYARLSPTPSLPLYARLGPLRHVTLGTGHLVHDFQTTSAWDDRTVGVETAVQLPFVRAVAFTDDVRLGGLTGGRVSVTPFPESLSPSTRSLSIGASVVTDLGLPAQLRTTALGVDARLAVLRLGDFALSPFATYSRFVEYGSGAGLGVTFASEELIGLGRLGATLGLFQSGEQFVPGYFNAFYSVSNPESRIWNANAYYTDRPSDLTVGTALAEASGGTSIYFRLRALVFDAFEFATFFRRDYSGDALSEGGLRLTVAPSRGEPLRFVFEVQRQGRTSFWSLFGDFRDQNVLVFHLDYALAGPARVFIRSRYGYERVADGPEGDRRYLVERRFEPFVGIRLTR